jgi:hypothetical protein
LDSVRSLTARLIEKAPRFIRVVGLGYYNVITQRNSHIPKIYETKEGVIDNENPR